MRCNTQQPNEIDVLVARESDRTTCVLQLLEFRDAALCKNNANAGDALTDNVKQDNGSSQ